MQKKTLLVLFLTISLSLRAQFPESFDAGVIPTGWTTFIGANGLGTGENWAAAAGGYILCYDENAGDVTEDWIVSPSVAITTTNSLLSFYEQTLYTAVYEPASMSVRVSTTSQTDISTFTSLSSLTATEIFDGSNSRSVDLSAYEGQTIYIAWVLEQNYGDGWLVDDISLNNQNAGAPSCAGNLAPVDGSTDVTVTEGAIALSWDAPTTGDPATSYEIFWGTTSGSLSSLGTLVGTSVNITNVDYSTTYYWSVVPLNAGGSATGCDELSFTTEAAPPAPDNDACVDATVVGSLPYSTSGDASGATNNDGFISADCGDMNDGVWFTFTPTTAGTVDVILSDVVGWDPEIALYTGSCGAFTCVEAADLGADDTGESLSSVVVAAGTQYWINIGNWSGTTDNAEGAYTLAISSTDTTTLGVENNTLEGFSLFPTTVEKDLKFASDKAVASIAIFNVLGQQVFASKPNVLNSSVDISSLKSGMYLVKVQVGKITGTYKIIKK